MKKFLTILLALALVCCAALAMAEEPTLTFRLAENQPEGNPITDGMYMFADLVNQ